MMRPPWLALSAVLVACFALGGSPLRADPAWQLTPYRVEALLALPAEPAFSGKTASLFAKRLEVRTAYLTGAAWNLEVRLADGALRYRALADPESVAMTDLPATALKAEKVILVVVRPEGAGHRMEAREFDVRTQTWNATVMRAARQRAKLGDAAVSALVTAFAPLGQIESIEEDVAQIRLRASALPPRDPAIRWIGPGSVLRPILRQNDRKGEARQIKIVPWTYFRATKVSRQGVACELHSGIRASIVPRHGGRIEQLALAVIPPRRPSRIVLQSRVNLEERLGGYDVYELGAKDEPARRLGRSDRQGVVVLEPTADLLRIVVIKNGSELLAKLPVVPGLEPELLAPIANDDKRLEVEGFINGFQEELVDLITRREVLVARATAYLDGGRIDAAREVVDRLTALPSKNDLAQELAREQKRTYTEDPGVQAKIDALFNDTRQLVDKHLDSDTIDAVVRRLREARRETAAVKP